MDPDAFVRDGYVAVRAAVDAGTVAACREQIWTAPDPYVRGWLVSERHADPRALLAADDRARR